MKILLFIDCLGAGGAQRQFVGLARMLKERGYEVNVVVYHDIPFYAPALEEKQIPCIMIGKGKLKALRFYYFYQLVKRMKPDWVISYLESPSLIACITKLLKGGVKLMVSERNTSQTISMSTKVRFNLFRLADYVV